MFNTVISDKFCRVHVYNTAPLQPDAVTAPLQPGAVKCACVKTKTVFDSKINDDFSKQAAISKFKWRAYHSTAHA